MVRDSQPTTFLEAVRTSLVHAAQYNPGDVVAPVAVLWTDADGQWRPVIKDCDYHYTNTVKQAARERKAEV